VRCIGVLDSLTELRGAIAGLGEPDIVFNLLEEFDGIVPTISTWWRSWNSCATAVQRAAIPRGCLLSRDKSLSASSCWRFTASPRRSSP